MTDRVRRFLDFHLAREYRNARTAKEAPQVDGNESFLYQSLYLAQFCQIQSPLLYLGEDDFFGFHLRHVLPLQTGHDMWGFTPDYAWALGAGFDSIRADLVARRVQAGADRDEYFRACIDSIDHILSYCEQVREEAVRCGAVHLAHALTRVPHQAARTYHEALVFMKLLIFFFRATNVNHLTLGRFDQYMYPYYATSCEDGMSRAQLTELTELFFLSINMDTDLCNGAQQGDNGQSLMLGGCHRDGSDAYNELSEVVLDASEELCLIDPKINLRVNRNTPLSRYEKGTRLTAKGMGFPQYCNDDVVIDGLCALGYELEDARDYTVAACWEFIIPAVGYDVANIGYMNFPAAVRRATVEALPHCTDFEQFFSAVEKEIDAEFAPFRERKEYYGGWLRGIRNPFASLFITTFRENAVDMGEMSAKYANFGIQGAGLAPAIDALTAIKTLVFDEKSLDTTELIAAMEANFVGYETLRNRLIAAPKMGNNDPVTNEIADRVLDFYARTVNGYPNAAGGIFRAGTGCPQTYVSAALSVGATADGRLAGAPYPSSFSPSIGTRPDGLLSVIQSFTHFDLKRVINGGPLTIELHDNLFRNEESISKVAMLVKLFIDAGGHQLQLNALNRERLLDAQKHPEQYPNLIVRVWGWSGYFRELDLCYQNQILSRTVYSV